MERTIRPRVLAVPIWILLAGAIPAFAQGGQGNGTLIGTVVDNVGVIPGATVTATHVATNTNRTGTTNEQGEFRLVSLSPGRYVMKVEMDGFRPVTIAEFSLLGGEIRPLGRITMTAGGITESVDYRGSHARADGQQRAFPQHHGRHAGVGAGEGPRRVRHDENSAGRHGLAHEPRLRAVELGALSQHQRRRLAQQEHDN